MKKFITILNKIFSSAALQLICAWMVSASFLMGNGIVQMLISGFGFTLFLICVGCRQHNLFTEKVNYEMRYLLLADEFLSKSIGNDLANGMVDEVITKFDLDKQLNELYPNNN